MPTRILPAAGDADALRSLTALLGRLPDAEPAAPVTDSTQLVDTLARMAAASVDDLPEVVVVHERIGPVPALELIREGGRSTGQVIAGLVSFFNPGLVVIGGGVTGLGHNLLAAIRTQVYRQSLPLATGNLPIVLGELGPTAGVIGAARLISDHLFSPA